MRNLELMFLYKHWNKKQNNIIKRIAGLASVFLFILLLALYADARDFFSIQYGLSCKQCHTKIPNLKEFGQNFKNNGYSLEKKVPAPKENPVVSEASAVQQQLSSAATTRKSANEKGKEDSALKEPPVQPPDKPEYLYRWRSKDGTYIFTDNPLRIPVENTARETKKYTGTSRKSRSRAVSTSKTVFSGMAKEKHHKIVSAPAGTDGMRKQGGPEYAVAQEPASKAEALPHNFEECMEKILIKIDRPKDAKEQMELFERAESSCAPYATSH